LIDFGTDREVNENEGRMIAGPRRGLPFLTLSPRMLSHGWIYRGAVIGRRVRGPIRFEGGAMTSFCSRACADLAGATSALADLDFPDLDSPDIHDQPAS